MTSAREDILSGIRRALRRGPVDAATAAAVRARVAAHRRHLIPARAAALPHREQVDLFVAMAEEVQATVARVAALAEVPEALARYLSGENLPAELVMAPDLALAAIPWETRPLLRLRRGRAEASDTTSLTPAFAAIAETGTLMLISGAGTPTTLNFLPDTHIVVLCEEQVVASYEDAWDRLRARPAPNLAGSATSPGGGGLPRTVNFITGPSRTADIEQHLELGAHGPRRLHIILVAEQGGTGDGEE